MRDLREERSWLQAPEILLKFLSTELMYERAHRVGINQ